MEVTEHLQAFYPVPTNQLKARRVVEGPVEVYYSRRPEPHGYKQIYNDQPPPLENVSENTTFVKDARMYHENDYARYDPSFTIPPERHPGLVLPSVEGGLPNAKDQQAFVRNSYQHMDASEPFKGNREAVQQPAPPIMYIASDEEAPSTKRRKMNDPHLSGGERRNNILPVHDREDYHDTHYRRAVDVYCQEEVAPYVLDKRIVQLPPREIREYNNSETRSQTLPERRQVSNYLVDRLLGGQSKVRHLPPEISEQSQSLRSSAASHLVSGHDTFVSSHVSAPEYREVPASHYSPHRASASFERNGRTNPDLQATRLSPGRFEEVRGEMPRHFRNLAIDPGTGGNSTIERNADMKSERRIRDSSQAPGLMYLPTRSDGNMHNKGIQERQYRAVDNDLSTSRSMQQQLVSRHGQRSSEQDKAMFAQYTPQHIERDTGGSFGRDSSDRRSRVTNWSGILRKTRSFDLADS